METNVLEQWLHNVIRHEVKEDPEYGQFIGKESIDQVTRADIDPYHLFKLRKILSYAYEKSTFYRQLFDKSGIEIDDIRSLDDIVKIPFTNPADLAQQPYQFLCTSLSDVARIITFTSSGTTGPKKRVFFTEEDIERLVRFMEVGLRTVTSSGDVVQILLPGGTPLGQLDLLARGVAKIGAFPVKAGTGLTSEEQLELLKKHKSTILFVRTGRIYQITQELLAGGYDVGKLGVKTIFVTSEYLSEAQRERFKSIWNCEVSFHYGLTEMGLAVAIECQVHNGFHFNEVDLLLEMIDPKTGRTVTDGSEGELVFTTWNREGMPLIRYRTHDISRLINEPCPCGATSLLRFGKITKRLESIVQIGEDDEIYPAMFDEAIFSIPEVIDYQVTVGKVGDRDTLFFKAEVTREGKDIYEAINKAVLSHPLIPKNVQTNKMALPRIELVPQGTLRRLTRAKKVIIDEREKGDLEEAGGGPSP